MTQSGITIVVPVHNRSEIVKRTLKSIQQQTYRPISVVLVDNGSTDTTMETLLAWQKKNNAPDFAIEVLQESEPGATSARNAGLAAVRTEFTMFFDSDDVMRPSHVARAVCTMRDNPQADIIGWDVVYDFGKRKYIKPFAATDVYHYSVIDGTMATQRYICRTALFRKAGGWDTTVKVWNDIELGIRLLALNPVIVKARGEPTVEVIHTQVSITGHDFSHNASAIAYTLDTIERHLPDDRKYIADMRRAIMAGRLQREARAYGVKAVPEASEMLRKAMAGEKGYRRVMLRLAYHYTRLGGRGAGRILKLLL